MDLALQRSLVRLRVISLIYGIGWIATPATFVAIVIAGPSFTLLGVDRAQEAADSVGIMFFFAFSIVAWMSPVFMWALGHARRAAGGSGVNPLLLALLTLALPYFPLGAVVLSASAALVRLDPRAGERVPAVLAWAGPALVLLGGLTMVVAGASAAVVVLCVAIVVYGVTRILIARRFHRLCTNLLLRPAVDAMRASHAEPVGGG